MRVRDCAVSGDAGVGDPASRFAICGASGEGDVARLPARKAIVVTLTLLVLAAVAIHPSLASLPWLPSTWNWQGINGDAPLVGRPIVLTKPIRAVIALAVYFTFCIFAGELTKAKELAGRACSSRAA
jgi:hypothetical protein